MATDLFTGCLISEYDVTFTPKKERWYRKYVDMKWSR